MFDFYDDKFWLVIAGFIIAFILACGLGANDVANSFGTSVGSGVLTLKQACILATIFEMLGSILIGAQVSGTIRKGIVNPNVFEGQEIELMLGYISALSGCCMWLILATILNLPVSATHSIVGATIGMAIVSKGFQVVQWFEVLKIILSWFISPLLSGVVSLIMFILVRRYILRAPNPLNAGLRFLPAIYTVTILVNVGGVVESSPPLLGFHLIPWWGKIILLICVLVLVYLCIWLVVVPFMKKKIDLILEESRQAKQKLDEHDEKYEKMKKIQHEKMLKAKKKNCEVQVDYVDLLVSSCSNNEECKSPQDAQIKLERPFDLKKQDSLNKLLHGDNTNSSNKRVAFNIPTLNRMDSCTSHDNNEDSIDYDDLNMTLGGYLNTYHSNAFKQHKQKIHNNNLNLSFFNNKQLLTTNIFKYHGHGQTNNNRTNSNNSFEKYKFNRLYSSPSKLEENKPFSDKDLPTEYDDQLQDFPESKTKTINEINNFAHSDPPETAQLFSFLQVLTAVFGSFAHGGNDVSNAIGPLIGLYLIYQDHTIQDKSDTPEWILFYGGVGISVGLWILGRRVIKTIGEDLTKITASSGFVIELASAMTVLGASLLKIPVSTTHCKVGSVVFTGRIRSKESIHWSLFRNIIIAWIVTVPVTGSIAAGFQLVLKAAFGIKL